MVFIRKPRSLFAVDARTQKLRHVEGERVQLGHWQRKDMQILSWKCFIMFFKEHAIPAI